MFPVPYLWVLASSAGGLLADLLQTQIYFTFTAHQILLSFGVLPQCHDHSAHFTVRDGCAQVWRSIFVLLNDAPCNGQG